MANLKLTDLKNQLKDYNHKELIQLIANLYKMNDEVKQYLSITFLGEEAVNMAFEKAKKDIKDEFFPSKGHGKLRLAVAKKAISDFKKLTKDETKTLDLMLFYVEMGSDFTNTYGDIDSGFYSSMMTMFRDVVYACDANQKIFNLFENRLFAVVKDSDGIGWGYSDFLYECYESIEWLNEE